MERTGQGAVQAVLVVSQSRSRVTGVCPAGLGNLSQTLSQNPGGQLRNRSSYETMFSGAQEVDAGLHPGSSLFHAPSERHGAAARLRERREASWRRRGLADEVHWPTFEADSHGRRRPPCPGRPHRRVEAGERGPSRGRSVDLTQPGGQRHPGVTPSSFRCRLQVLRDPNAGPARG